MAALPPVFRRLLFLLIVPLATNAVHAGDWRDTLTPKRGNFPTLRPLTAHYEFGWSGFKAAAADATFSQTKSGRLQLDLTGGTTGAARALWRMDVKATSTCNAAN